MRDLEATLDDLHRIAVAKDEAALSAITLELETAVLTVDVLPHRFIDEVSKLLEDERFLALTESWKVVRLVYDCWEQLGSEQKDRIRPLLVRSFDKCGDWMGAFVTAEMFADERALNDLPSLVKPANFLSGLSYRMGWNLLPQLPPTKHCALEPSGYWRNSPLAVSRTSVKRPIWL